MTLTLAGRYNFKGHDERLVYLGKEGAWHLFQKVHGPSEIWCEILEEDLQLIEETKSQ